MYKTVLILASLAAFTAGTSAAIVVNFTADGAGRFADYFSGAYAQINLDPDGMYSLADDSPFGSVDAFPSEGNWSGVGELTLSGTVLGSGVENFTITGGVFDINAYVDGAVASAFGDYTTTLSGVTGSVALNDGVVTSLTVNSNIAFSFLLDPSASFDGALTLSETTFDLFVDETESVDTGVFGVLPVRQAWDFGGTTAASVVPEPTTFGMLVAAFALACAGVRHWKRS